MAQLSYPYMTPGTTIALTRQTFFGKVMSLLFNMLITFPRSKHLLISWLQLPSTVILEPKKIKSVTVYTISPSVFHEVIGPDAMIFVFWMLSFKPTFSFPSFTSIKSLLRFLPGDYWYFSWQSWFQLVLHPAHHFSWCTIYIDPINWIIMYLSNN